MRFAFRNLFADTSYETSSLCRRIRGAPIVLVLEIEKKENGVEDEDEDEHEPQDGTNPLPATF